MSRPRRLRKRSRQLTDLEWAFLNDAVPEGETYPSAEHGFALWALEHDYGLNTGAGAGYTARLWQQYRKPVLQRWAEEHPGTRPSLWWKYDAPRAGCASLGMPPEWPEKYPEPRRWLGGIGTPLYEVSAYTPEFCFGIPARWVEPVPLPTPGFQGYSSWQVEHEKAFRLGFPIDPGDPPIFESQAIYLKRHKLLLPGEDARLTKEDFEPERPQPRSARLHDGC